MISSEDYVKAREFVASFEESSAFEEYCRLKNLVKKYEWEEYGKRLEIEIILQKQKLRGKYHISDSNCVYQIEVDNKVSCTGPFKSYQDAYKFIKEKISNHCHSPVIETYINGRTYFSEM